MGTRWCPRPPPFQSWFIKQSYPCSTNQLDQFSQLLNALPRVLEARRQGMLSIGVYWLWNRHVGWNVEHLRLTYLHNAPFLSASIVHTVDCVLSLLVLWSHLKEHQSSSHFTPFRSWPRAPRNSFFMDVKCPGCLQITTVPRRCCPSVCADHGLFVLYTLYTVYQVYPCSWYLKP